eukprot:UC1_evm1s1922
MAWTCHACTLINKKPHAPVCEACQTQRQPVSCGDVVTTTSTSNTTTTANIAIENRLPQRNGNVFTANAATKHVAQHDDATRALVSIANVNDNDSARAAGGVADTSSGFDSTVASASKRNCEGETLPHLVQTGVHTDRVPRHEGVSREVTYGSGERGAAGAYPWHPLTSNDGSSWLRWDSSSAPIEAFILRAPPSNPPFQVAWISVDNPSWQKTNQKAAAAAATATKSITTDLAEFECYRSVIKELDDTSRVPQRLKRAAFQKLLDIATEKGIVSGKWIVRSPPHRVDAVWAAVASAVASGSLGFSAKVSPRPPGGSSPIHVICVYSSDFNDTGKLLRLRQALEHAVAGVIEGSTLCGFKPDAVTMVEFLAIHTWGYKEATVKKLPKTFSVEDLRLRLRLEEEEEEEEEEEKEEEGEEVTVAASKKQGPTKRRHGGDDPVENTEQSDL